MRGGLNEAMPLVYTIEFEINLLDFDPKYPKNPKTLASAFEEPAWTGA